MDESEQESLEHLRAAVNRPFSQRPPEAAPTAVELDDASHYADNDDDDSDDSDDDRANVGAKQKAKGGPAVATSDANSTDVKSAAANRSNAGDDDDDDSGSYDELDLANEGPEKDLAPSDVPANTEGDARATPTKSLEARAGSGRRDSRKSSADVPAAAAATPPMSNTAMLANLMTNLNRSAVPLTPAVAAMPTGSLLSWDAIVSKVGGAASPLRSSSPAPLSPAAGASSRLADVVVASHAPVRAEGANTPPRSASPRAAGGSPRVLAASPRVGTPPRSATTTPRADTAPLVPPEDFAYEAPALPRPPSFVKRARGVAELTGESSWCVETCV
jgi:hypothetical protein